MQGLIDRILAAWLPRELQRQAGEELRRAQLTVCVAVLHVVASLSWAVIASAALARPGTQIAWASVSAAVGCAVAWMARKPGLVRAAARLQIAVVLTTLGSASLLGVGLRGGESYLLMGTVPILATALIGCREGFYWTVTSAGLLGLGALSWPEPAAQLTGAGSAAAWVRWIASVGVGGIVLLLSTLLETLRSSTVGELADANAALEAAQRDAASAHEAKVRFLTNMSHEFRTPMNSVISTTDLLSRSELPLELRDLSATACQGALSLLSLFHQMLCATLESVDQEPERVPCDLPEIVYGVARSFSARSGEDPWILIVDYSQEAPRRFLGDPLRVRQVLLNLVANAAKFTQSGHVRIVVRPAGLSGRVRVEVEDTGIGVPEDQHDVIFQRFTQADVSNTRRYGGAGLGLPISRDLVHSMGGSMGLQSVVGEGSVFWFELPADGSQTQPVPRLPAPIPVLLVEPYEAARSALVSQLRGLGLTPVAPESVEQALALADGKIPCEHGSLKTVIVVHDSPRIDALAWLGRRERRDVPAVVVSTRACRLDDAERAALGITSWLLTPVPTELFGQVVPAASARASDTPDAAPTGLGLGNLRILLVEDFVPNQKVARHILTRLGCLVDIAANGREALEYLAKHEYDAVLMDCQMPEMDGYEATRRFRVVEEQQGRNRRIPIIAVTANALPEDRRQCIDAGMDDYLAKPIKLESLRDALLRNA